MQAFIAVLLIAAVSGQMTSGVDRSVFDYIKYRQMLPVGQTTFATQQQLLEQQLLNGVKYPSMYYTQQQGQDQILTNTNTGVYGDLTLNQQVLPSTFQFNIPSDVTLYTYTLRQLVQLPVFGDFLQLPLFRQFVQTPAFQLYLTSGDFQKFLTQPIFRQFFVDPVLFYKFIYPVVQQYQQYYTTIVAQQQPITGLDMNAIYKYNTIKNINTIRPFGMESTVFGQRGIQVPTTFNNIYNNQMYKNLINKNFVNNDEILLNKQYETVFPAVFGQQKMYNTKNILDLLVGDYSKVLPTIYGQQKMIQKTLPFAYPTSTVYGGETLVKSVDTLLLESLLKDLVQGKIDINDLKTQNFVNEKIVDPITGEYKIVDDKIVKPILETVVEGETLTKDALIKKMLMNKTIFNKL